MNAQSVALRSHVLSLRVFIAVSMLALALMAPSPARAAELTENQISAILSLLSSFGADQSVVSNTERVLRGSKVGVPSTIPTPKPSPTPSPACPVYQKPICTEDQTLSWDIIKVPAGSCMPAPECLPKDTGVKPTSPATSATSSASVARRPDNKAPLRITMPTAASQFKAGDGIPVRWSTFYGNKYGMYLVLETADGKAIKSMRVEPQSGKAAVISTVGGCNDFFSDAIDGNCNSLKNAASTSSKFRIRAAVYAPRDHCFGRCAPVTSISRTASFRMLAEAKTDPFEIDFSGATTSSVKGGASSPIPSDSLVGSLGYFPESLSETMLALGGSALDATADSIRTLALMIEDFNGALANLAGAYAALLTPAQAASEGRGIADIAVFPSRVVAGDTLNLSWDSDASECMVTTGDYAAFGAQGVKRLRAMLPGDYVFELRCVGADGVERVAQAPVAVLSEEVAADHAGSEALLAIAYLPESLYETMAGATEFMAAVEMAPAQVIADGLADVLYEAGIY